MAADTAITDCSSLFFAARFFLLHLKDLPNLTELALIGTDVDVSVLEILSEFSRPLTVSITTYEEELPEEALKKFRAGHPHLEIHYNLNTLPK